MMVASCDRRSGSVTFESAVPRSRCARCMGYDGNSFLDLSLHVKIAFFVGLVAASFITAVAAYLVQTGHFLILPPKPVYYPQSFASKLEFSARYWVLGAAWILFSMTHVMLRRIYGAMNPLSGTEGIVVKSNNILRNSIEQFIVSLVVQVSAITYLTGEEVVRCIPVMNVMFFIGRVSFWFGYPKYRTFGFCLSLFPTGIVCVYVLYKFATVHLALSLS